MTLSTAVHILLQLVALACAAATLPGTLHLTVLTLGAWWRLRPAGRLVSKRSVKLAVLVPAHNEESTIAACVQKTLQSCYPLTTDIFVIADNCTDRTAAVAAAAGARVSVRNNLSTTGKGAALRHGFRLVFSEGFDAVMVIDADSYPSPGVIDRARQVLETGCDALQCRYRVANKEASPRTRLMDLAFLAQNVLRPRGRNRLGFSCGVVGNGFALHRELLAAVPYDSNSIVEDLDYHINVVHHGRRVEFIDSATVWGEMPVAREGSLSQRARWEGGRLGTAKHWLPIIGKQFLKGQWRLAEPIMDLLTLPLGFHAMALLAMAAIPEPWSRIYAAAALVVLAAHVISAALLSEKPLASLSAILVAPFYMLWKLRVISSLLRFARRDASWVRTARIIGSPAVKEVHEPVGK